MVGAFWRYHDAPLPGTGDMMAIDAQLLSVTIEDLNRTHQQPNARLAGKKMRWKRACEEAQREPRGSIHDLSGEEFRRLTSPCFEVDQPKPKRRKRRQRRQLGNVVYLAGAGPKGGAS